MNTMKETIRFGTGLKITKPSLSVHQFSFGKQQDSLGPPTIVKSSQRFGAVDEFGAFNELLI